MKARGCLNTVSALAAVGLSTIHAGPVVSEFLAINRTGLEDASGEASDWIEIYNPDAEPVDLVGWTLTDRADNPEKWRFPALQLGPDERLVVFASGKDKTDENDDLHTNFRLSGNGEHLALVNPDGDAVWSVDFPPQHRDISYGSEGGGMPLRWYPDPTPGEPNPSNAGPVVVEPGHIPAQPAEGEDLVLSVRVLPGENLVVKVEARFQVMFGTRKRLVMNDNGENGDAEAGDGIYSCTARARNILAANYDAGEMLRWYFAASDSLENTSYLPPVAVGSDKPVRQLGVVVADSNIDSDLPVLRFFVENTARSVTQSGSTGAVFFQGRFNDNVFVRRRGQFGAIDWSKPKLKFDFSPGDHFVFREDQKAVEEFNLQSHYRDGTRVRENAAYAFFNQAGTPAPQTEHWVVYRNGEYYGLFSYVEQVDSRFLERNDLDPEGAMYKANGFPSTLAANVTTGLYQKETRKDEPYDDLREFAAGINGRNGINRFHYVLDHVHLPALVNEMACQTILTNGDRLTKNYYMHNDPETGFWRRIPWDMDGAFPLGGTLTQENFNSPLYGDTDHPQAAGQPVYQNFLLDAILDSKMTRAMYMRRLRTLMDMYLSAEDAYFENLLDDYFDHIRQAVVADENRWSIGSQISAFNRIKNEMLPTRRHQLNVTYGPDGEDLVPLSPTTDIEITFGQIDFRPGSGNGEEEFVELVNRGSEAVDISGWSLSGDIEYDFPPGTVLSGRGSILQPLYGKLYLCKDVRAFRLRQTTPRGNQGRFLLGNYSGQLSARGGTLTLKDSAAEVVAEHTFDGDPSPAQRYLRITEIHADPIPATDAEIGRGFATADFEFVEIANLGPDPLDLKGVRFTDGIGLTLETETVLRSGGIMVVTPNTGAFRWRHGDDPVVVGQYGGRLDNSGERLTLRDGEGETVLSWRYPESSGPGFSLFPEADSTAAVDWEAEGTWRSADEPGGDPGNFVRATGLTYTQWADLVFPAEETMTSPEDDPNGDGLPNLAAYAAGRNPYQSGEYFSLYRKTDGAILVRFPRNPAPSDVQVRLESSSDLNTWSAWTGTFDVETDFRTATIPSHQTQPFWRLRFTLP